MNIWQWLLNYKLDDNNELDLQFGMSVVCIWLIVLAFCYGIVFLILGVSELLYLMIAVFVTSWLMFFYSSKASRPSYTITYLYFTLLSVLAHISITYYLGNCGTEFFVVASLIAPHMYLLLKQQHTFIMDVFLLIVISFVFWFGSYHAPVYAGLVGSTFRIILVNVGLFTCLIELYLNMSTQNFLTATRKKLVERASAAAVIDALTGLGNRRMLEQHRAELEKACTDRSPLCIAILDIDFFKKINDTYGHTVGDHVLEFTANTMRDFFRKSDLLIRWGGEEFLVILRHTKFEDAAYLMERFRLKMQNMPMVVGDKEINVCLTIGLTEISPNTPLDDAIKKADELMYLGKLQGRNCLIWHRL